MCSDFCLCPGNLNDAHYNQYAAVGEPVYNSFGRTWAGSLNPSLKPLKWTYGDSSYERYYSLTAKQCFDNTAAIYNQISDLTNKAGYAAGQTADQIARNSQYIANEQLTVATARPNQKWDRLITYFEQKYDCSGFCYPALFYYSQPVTKGLPQEGCLKGFLEDIDREMLDLGIVFIVTAVILTFMLCCACPVCCYQSEFERDMMFNYGPHGDKMNMEMGMRGYNHAPNMSGHLNTSQQYN